MTTALAAVSLFFAAVPAYFYFRNVAVFKPLPQDRDSDSPVSVLIPARNEAANIVACIMSVLDGVGADVEVVILDDHSEDDTAEIVGRLVEKDPRVRLVAGKPLPAGWNGKQHACWQLAQHARHETLVFLDADVRLQPGGVSRIAAAFASGGADLLSGFPRQQTGSLAERLLIPLIHFVLLGFLSLRHLRRVQKPEFAAGCGQLFVTRRAAYEKSGGHAAIRASRHDGIKLPRLYLQKGFSIDLFDATDLATVRMYHGAVATWRGLAKNADEGVATPGLILPVTAMLLAGQVAPGVVLAWSVVFDLPADARLVALLAAALSYAPRLDAVWRFKEPLVGALLHPLGVLLFLAIQWSALYASLTGKQVEWKGRPAALAKPTADGQ